MARKEPGVGVVREVLAVSSLAEKLNNRWIVAVLRLDRIVTQGEAGVAEFFEQRV